MEKSLAALVERASVAEKVVNCLQSERSENASRKRKLNSALESVADRRREVEVLRESLEKRERDLEEREREFLAFQESKKREFAYEEQRLSSKKEKAGKKLKMIEEKVESLRLDQESLLEKEKMVNVVIVTLDDRITAVEEKEEEFDLFKEGKMREIALEEEELKKKWEELVKDTMLRNEQLMEREKLGQRLLERLELAKNDVEGLKRRVGERFVEIGLKETELKSIRDWLEGEMDEADFKEIQFEEREGRIAEKEDNLITKENELQGKEKSLLAWEKELEDKQKEFDLAGEASKQVLGVMSKELMRDAELRNEQLLVREKLGHELLERLSLAKDNVERLQRGVRERYVRNGLKETELESIRGLVQKKMDETVLKAEEFEEQEKRIAEREDHLISKENELKGKENTLLAWQKGLEDKQKKMKEFEKMKTEFIAFQEKKMGEMALKEQQLAVMDEELVKNTMLKNEQLMEREKLGHQLLEKLELAKNDVEEMKRRVRERYVKIGLIETELESIRVWVQKKMDETDLKGEEFEERQGRIAGKEDHLISKENELSGKENTLLAWQKGLEDKQKELEDKQKEVDLMRKSSKQQMEKLNAREKSINSLKQLTRNCFNEHRAMKRRLEIERDLVQQSAIDLAQRAEHLNHAQKDLELKEKQMSDAHKELKLKEQNSTNVFNASSKIESHESGAELTFTSRMVGKTLQMLLNDTENDLESMCDEIFKVLPLSSDPAKLVLDSMVGFYPPHLRTEDVELNVRRTCIALLGKLIKMSPNIKPHVREEAFQVATSWKSKMGATGENAKSLEVLGFLLLLSAFKLASYFDKDEIYSFLMMVGQHKKAPELHCALGFAESTSVASTSLRRFGKEKERSVDESKRSNDGSIVVYSEAGEMQNLETQGIHADGSVDLSDAAAVVKKKREYQEPRDCHDSHHPITRPYSGDPEEVDEAEFEEGLKYDENSLSSASKLGLLDQDDTPRMLVFTLPSNLPLGRQPSNDSRRRTDDNFKAVEKILVIQRKYKEMKSLEAPLLGKMLVYKRGAVKLKLGDIMYDVSPGVDWSFLQKVMAINVADKQCCELGEGSKRAVVTPDIDSLLNTQIH